MHKKLYFCLVGLWFVIAFGVGLVGCGKVEEFVKELDPGRITSPEATLSGSAVYSGGTVDINLNAIIVSGDAVTLDKGHFKIYVGSASKNISEWESVDFTLPSGAARPMDMVFILDNTGSMSNRIRAVKDSIIAFTQTLEAAGVDVKFGVVSFGDTTWESENLPLPATAEAVATWLNNLSGVTGGDSPENPLNAIMLAWNTFTWREGAQRVFVVITDNPCHQLGDGTTFADYTVASVEAALLGKATVYAVSPKIDSSHWSGPGRPKQFAAVNVGSKEGDVRWLADGYGWFVGVSAETYGVVKPFTGTGGKWIELPAGSGGIDLTTLGISTTAVKGYTLRFSYAFTAGTWYIHIFADTNKDGRFDSDLILELRI